MDTFLKDRLQVTLNNICKKVYELMRVDKDENINIRQIHEDGISSIILKELVNVKSTDLIVKAKSLDVKESSTGMDFDLWIGESDEKYVRLLIQAKSYRNETSTDGFYESVKKEQCENLLKQKESKDYGLDKYSPLPIYFFYQHIDSDDVCEKFFAFDENLRPEDVSVTFTSALTVKNLINKESVKYADLHKNEIAGKYTSDLSVFDMIDSKDKNICLPLTSLSDLSVQMVKKFEEIKSPSVQNSAGFFFFFPFNNSDSPLKIHDITSNQILKLYEETPVDGHRIKNVVVLNDDKFATRTKIKRRKSIIKELTK